MCWLRKASCASKLQCVEEDSVTLYPLLGFSLGQGGRAFTSECLLRARDTLCTLYKLFHLEMHSNSVRKHYDPHFTDEQTEARMISLTQAASLVNGGTRMWLQVCWPPRAYLSPSHHLRPEGGNSGSPLSLSFCPSVGAAEQRSASSSFLLFWTLSHFPS